MRMQSRAKSEMSRKPKESISRDKQAQKPRGLTAVLSFLASKDNLRKVRLIKRLSREVRGFRPFEVTYSQSLNGQTRC